MMDVLLALVVVLLVLSWAGSLLGAMWFMVEGEPRLAIGLAVVFIGLSTLGIWTQMEGQQSDIDNCLAQGRAWAIVGTQPGIGIVSGNVVIPTTQTVYGCINR